MIATVTLGAEDFEMKAVMRQHELLLDEPVNYGGKDLGPASMELLCATLGACTVATLKMYLNRKGWQIHGLEAVVERTATVNIKPVFTVNITVKGDLTPEQTQRMLDIANACPVHKALEGSNKIITKLEVNGS
ncbi:putative redox protein [Chitinophaga skermanii]|uniref:Putative redox protein n=1 Tax=Chitinophaga skermanii TaxID=331697 RepID=A0A327QM17_9BACT|nr:OsmC family protein [Chitinophaga skermanii]RAJ05301.1 putative redox protein [Chitinophaga skermanii]